MQILVRQLRHDVERQNTHMRRAIDVERRIACVICVLAAQCGYRTAGHLFGVSDSSISNMMRDVCFAIVTILQPRLIRIPTADTLRIVCE